MSKRCPDGHVYNSSKHDSCQYCGKPPEDEQPAALQLKFDIDNAPTGWLVCVRGPSIGRDYKIVSGSNYIGRADGMDIQIKGDKKIERTHHASILFDRNTKKTKLIPGNSRYPLIMKNDIVTGATEIESHDVFETGDSKFVFISLWNDKGDWAQWQKDHEDALEKETKAVIERADLTKRAAEVS